MTTRQISIVFLVAALVLGRPAPGRAHYHPGGGEFGLGVGAAAANLVYLPAKTVVAVGGLFLGAAVGLLTGGDVRSAYGVWVPAASGTFLLTASHLDGDEPIEFFGSDYEDRPSTVGVGEAGGIYEAQYSQ